MTEDDTYDALRRIPIADMEARIDLISDFIRTNEWIKRADRIRNEKEEQRMKFAQKFPFFFKKEEMYIYINDAVPDTVFEGTFNHAAEGTGWTYSDYIKEIQKDIKHNEECIKEIKRKRTEFFVLALFPALLIIVPTIFLTPLLFKIPVGIVLGFTFGKLLAHIGCKMYPNHEFSNSRHR